MTITEHIRIAVNEATEAARQAMRDEMLLSLVGLVDAVRVQYPAAHTLTLEQSDQGPWLWVSHHDGRDEDQDLADDAEGYASHLYTYDEDGALMCGFDNGIVDGLVRQEPARGHRSIDYTLDIDTFMESDVYAETVHSLT